MSVFVAPTRRLTRREVITHHSTPGGCDHDERHTSTTPERRQSDGTTVRTWVEQCVGCNYMLRSGTVTEFNDLEI